MRRVARQHVLGALIAERRQVEAGKQVFSPVEQHRREGQMQFVDQPGSQLQ